MIDLRTLRPLDIDTVVESVEEDQPLSSPSRKAGRSARLGAEIAARSWRGASTISTRRSTRVTGKDVPMPYAANLEKLALPSVDEVVEAVKAVCYR